MNAKNTIDQDVSLKKRIFFDIDGVLAKFNVVDTLEVLFEKGYFLNLEPQLNVVNAAKEIFENHNDIEVFIMSAVLTDSKYALDEKNAWLDKYLPQIDKKHRIFPPCGSDKKEYIPGGVKTTDFLLDDYTNNLILWQPPAKGIKLLNGINNTKGTWQYDRLDYRKNGSVLAENIVSIIKKGEIIKDIFSRKEIIMDNIDDLKADMSTLNRFAILQLREHDESTHYKGFRSLEDLKEAPTGNDYEMIYFEVGEPNVKLNEEEVFERFNSNSLRPSNYYGHSMSVSDVILIDYEGEVEAYFCDSFGFKKLDNEFLTEKLLDNFKHGFDIRKDYENLFNIATNRAGLTENEYDRLSFLETNYKPIFEMADKRAVILDNQYRLNAIREYELQGGEAFNNGITDQNIGDSTVYFKENIFRENSSAELEKLIDERFYDRVANIQIKDDELPFPDASTYKYYSIQKPITFGTYPESGSLSVENYDKPIFIETLGIEAFGEIHYSVPLSQKQKEEYDLIDDPSNNLILSQSNNPLNDRPYLEVSQGAVSYIMDVSSSNSKSDEFLMAQTVGKYEDFFSVSEFERITSWNDDSLYDLKKGVTPDILFSMYERVEQYNHDSSYLLNVLNEDKLNRNEILVKEYLQSEHFANDKGEAYAVCFFDKSIPSEFFNSLEAVTKYVEKVTNVSYDIRKYAKGRASDIWKQYDFRNEFIYKKQEAENNLVLNGEKCKLIEKWGENSLKDEVTLGQTLDDPNIYYARVDNISLGHVTTFKFDRIPSHEELRDIYNEVDFRRFTGQKIDNIIDKSGSISQSFRMADEINYFDASATNLNNVVKEDVFLSSDIKVSKDIDTNDLVENLIKGVGDFMNSDKYKAFLNFQSKLYNYSLNNTMLIALQKPEASIIGSFNFWKSQNRFVKKGEKGLLIIAPTVAKKDIEIEAKDSFGKVVFDENGLPMMKKEQVSYIGGFKYTSVFDISQTEGEPIPTLTNRLHGSSEISIKIIDTIKNISEVPIELKPDLDINGCFIPKENKILIKDGMSPDQTAKTLLHEYTHSKEHTDLKEYIKNRNSSEIEAESVAYIVSKKFGLDTSEYSFGYISSWAEGKDLKEMKSTLDRINKSANKIITEVTAAFENEYKKDIELGIKQFKKDLENSGFSLNTKLSNIYKNIYLQGDKAFSLKEIFSYYKGYKQCSDEIKKSVDIIGNELKNQEQQKNLHMDQKVNLEPEL